MVVSGGFDSATGLSTGDNLDHALATSRDAAQLMPNLRDDPDAGGQIRSAAHGPTPSLWDDPDAGGQIHSAVHRPAPNLRDDPDAGGQIHSAVQPFAGGQHQFAPPDMASASDQLVMRGVTPQLVQAMASFFAAGAADTSHPLPLGAEPSQQPFLTTPQSA
jgi:hypothetical protein